VFKEWGFSEAPLINGISYYCRRFERNGWGLSIQYDRRENYADVRIASDLEHAPIGMDLLMLAKRQGVSIDRYRATSRSLPLAIRYEYLARVIFPKIQDYVVRVSATPRKPASPKDTRHPNGPPHGRGPAN